MSEPTKAVFLSYAREDTDPARRIAEALRASGLEVWFDQNELRGGDSWDAKIKKQIRECALFLAVVSARTQERPEGYFRREWKLAVERTHDMAAGVSFLVPVVIDDTIEVEALVPEEFMRVHWTRLGGGLPTTEFVAQVKTLLSTGRRRRPTIAPMSTGQTNAPMRTRPPMTALPPLAPKPPAPVVVEAPPPRKKSGRSAGIWLGLVVVLLAAAAAYFFLLRPAEPAAPPPRPAAKTPSDTPAPGPRPPAAVDKSIAVLPFANMSSDKENEFFTDGIHEDILTNLALIRDVRVVSRTSVMQYRGTTKPITQIAAELKVAYVLEGSVRRSGNKVRVTGQLIRAGNDEHLWAKSYDRDLTDVFTIQGEIATAIAGALQSVLTPEARSILEHRPTDNPAAYDLFLKARQLRYHGNMTESHVILPLLEQAVQLDPKFAAAWGELGSRRAYVWFNMDRTDALLAGAREAIETAVRLAPDDPVVIGSEGDFYYYCYRDYARATENYARLAQLRPSDPAVFWSMALIQRRQGRWADSWKNLQRALELDPANPSYANVAMELLTFGQRYTEGEVLGRKFVQTWPEDLALAGKLALLTYSARGATAEMSEFARLAVPPARRAEHLYFQHVLALVRGDWAEVIRLDGLQRHFRSEDDPTWQQDVSKALAWSEMGNLPAARDRMREALAAMQAEETRQPGNDVLWINLALAHAFLGDKTASMRCREKALALMPLSRDAMQGASNLTVLASALAWCGDKEQALKDFERLLRLPWGTNIHRERGGWVGSWKPLRDDPRFQKLLNDPKNNAPLF